MLFCKGSYNTYSESLIQWPAMLIEESRRRKLDITLFGNARFLFLDINAKNSYSELYKINKIIKLAPKTSNFCIVVAYIPNKNGFMLYVARDANDLKICLIDVKDSIAKNIESSKIFQNINGLVNELKQFGLLLSANNLAYIQQWMLISYLSGNIITLEDNYFGKG